MSGIKKQTMERAISMLNALGATFAIIEKDGTKHGTLEVIGGKRAKNKYPFGELSNYAKTYIEKMKVGEVKEVPYGKYEPEEVRSAVVSWAGYHWGNGSMATATVKDKKVVEILRIK